MLRFGYHNWVAPAPGQRAMESRLVREDFGWLFEYFITKVTGERATENWNQYMRNLF